MSSRRKAASPSLHQASLLEGAVLRMMARRQRQVDRVAGAFARDLRELVGARPLWLVEAVVTSLRMSGRTAAAEVLAPTLHSHPEAVAKRGTPVQYPLDPVREARAHEQIVASNGEETRRVVGALVGQMLLREAEASVAIDNDPDLQTRSVGALVVYEDEDIRIEAGTIDQLFPEASVAIDNDPDLQTRSVEAGDDDGLDLDAMNRGRAAVGMAPLSAADPRLARYPEPGEPARILEDGTVVAVDVEFDEVDP